MKALIPLGGRTLLERTLAVLRATGRIERMVVVGPPEVADHAAVRGASAVLPEGPSGSDNVLRGLEWLVAARDEHQAERALLVTTDLPFLTPTAVTGFLDACPPELDICLPLFTRQEVQARFPKSAPFCVGLRDGDWLIGCAFLLNPQAILDNRALIERVFAARKNPFAMARLLGPRFIARYLTRQLTVAHIEQRSLGLLGCTGRGIRGCSPELAFDIDRARDYIYALEHRAEAGW
jgi:hypothetical protein